MSNAMARKKEKFYESHKEQAGEDLKHIDIKSLIPKNEKQKSSNGKVINIVNFTGSGKGRLDRRLDFKEANKLRALILEEYGTVSPKIEAFLKERGAEGFTWVSHIKGDRERGVGFLEEKKTPVELPKEAPVDWGKRRKWTGNTDDNLLKERIKSDQSLIDRIKRTKNPYEFLILVYEPYIGYLSKVDLRGGRGKNSSNNGLDRTLYNELLKHFSKKNKKILNGDMLSEEEEREPRKLSDVLLARSESEDISSILNSLKDGEKDGEINIVNFAYSGSAIYTRIYREKKLENKQR